MALTKVPDSLLQSGGVLTVLTRTTSYSILGSDDLILGDTSGGPFTLTLPSAATVGAGKEYIIKYTDSGFANALTVDGNGSETIDGDLTKTLRTEGESLTIVSDGTNWVVISRIIPGISRAYTPTITGFGAISPTSVTFIWSRDDEYIEVHGVLTSGTSSAVTASLSLPSGLNIDTTDISGIYLIGDAVRDLTSATRNDFTMITDTGTSTSLVYFGVRNDNVAQRPLLPANGNDVLSPTNKLSVRFRVRIAEWIF